MEKNISQHWKGNRANVAFLISDAIDFTMEAIEADKNGHYMIKEASN